MTNDEAKLSEIGKKMAKLEEEMAKHEEEMAKHKEAMTKLVKEFKSLKDEVAIIRGAKKAHKMTNIFLSALDMYADIRSAAEEKNVRLDPLESKNCGRDGIFLSFYKKKLFLIDVIESIDDWVKFFESKYKILYCRNGSRAQLIKLYEMLMSEDFNIVMAKGAIVEDLHNLYAMCTKTTKKYEVYQEFVNFIDEYEVK